MRFRIMAAAAAMVVAAPAWAATSFPVVTRFPDVTFAAGAGKSIRDFYYEGTVGNLALGIADCDLRADNCLPLDIHDGAAFIQPGRFFGFYVLNVVTGFYLESGFIDNLTASSAGGVRLSGSGPLLLPPGSFSGTVPFSNNIIATTAEVRIDRLSGAQIIDPVPEPTTWAMMIAGIGIVGTALRRRRKAYPRVTIQAAIAGPR